MMYYPLSGYKLDTYDLYGIWKIKVKKITGLYQFLSRKGDISQSWPDSDGEEAFYLSTDIFFEGKDIILFCFMTADSFTSFQSQLTSFKHRLELGVMHTLALPYTTTTYSLLYIKGSDIDMLTPKLKSNKYVGEFWVQFRETTPKRS